MKLHQSWRLRSIVLLGTAPFIIGNLSSCSGLVSLFKLYGRPSTWEYECTNRSLPAVHA